MQLFMYTVQIPDSPSQTRQIKTVIEKPTYILNWNIKELNQTFSGEFSWKKIGLYGVCAIQYINPSLVRLLVKAPNYDMAASMVASFVVFLDPLKTHKKLYARSTPHVKDMQVANSLATNAALRNKTLKLAVHSV